MERWTMIKLGAVVLGGMLLTTAGIVVLVQVTTNDPIDFRVVTDVLDGGAISELSIKASGPGTIYLPATALPLFNNSVVNQTRLDFDGDHSWPLLVSPWAEEVVIQVDLGPAMKTITIPVQNVSHEEMAFVSGKNVVDHMKCITQDPPDPGFASADTCGYNGRYISSELSGGLYRGAIHFRDKFRSFGLEAEIRDYRMDPDPDDPLDDFIIINVVAKKYGRSTETWIGFGAHMDVAPPVAPLPGGLPGYGTWEGALDDTSGSASIIEMARALSQIETEYSLFFGLWSSEEEGIWGSSEFVDHELSELGGEVKTYVNMDMVGIGWPGRWDNGTYYPLNGYFGGKRTSNTDVEPVPILEGFYNWSLHQWLEVPEIPVVFNLGYSTFGRSDHVSFQREGIPSGFLIGIYDNLYPEYHRIGDTFENMLDYMGGEEMMALGFDIIVWMGVMVAIYLDNDMELHQNTS